MRRLIPAICLLLASALPCQAQGEKPKPNTLTPKEIADGWILLFDGETTFGWKADGKPLKVAEGALIPSSGDIFSSTARFAEFELHFEYKKKKEGRASFGVDVLLGDVGRQFNGLSLAAAEKWSAGTIRSSGGKVEMMREGAGGEIPPFALGRLCFSSDEGNNLATSS
jgi:hypothetical protein